MTTYTNPITQILEYCQAHLTPVRYVQGDIIVDHENDPYLYVFESGNYSVKTHLLNGDNYEIGNIASPDIMGEGILFGHETKAVKVIAMDDGLVYRLAKEDIEEASRKVKGFRENLTTVCLLSSNNRISEANTERMLLYTMSAYLQDKEQKSIIPLLRSMKQLFSMHSVFWIERHEILEDVFAVRYSSENIYPINNRIDMRPYEDREGVCIQDFEGEKGCTFVFTIRDQEKVFGYIALSHPDKENIPGYVGRIFRHMNSLFIEVIEREWKKRQI